jgi:hypothetical protein
MFCALSEYLLVLLNSGGVDYVDYERVDYVDYERVDYVDYER